MIEAVYISSNGKKFNLIGDKMRITNGRVHKYSWKKVVIAGKYGDILDGFTKEACAYRLTITFRGGLLERMQMLDDLRSAFERDIATGTPGKLYFGKYYIECFIVESDTYVSETQNNWSDNEIEIYCPSGFWITESTKSFTTAGSQSGAVYEFLDYPYDYDYDYAPDFYPPEIINIDHYADCKFLLKIYGPAIDPSVTINGIERKVYVTLEEGQYLLIDARDKTVKRILIDGTALDAFDNRKKAGKSIFTPMIPGLNTITWNHNFGFDLTIFKERSEPQWR